jgi:hypothetical protein
MTLPGYAAATSVYPTSRSYRKTRSGLTGATAATIVAQHDPYNRGGGGGGGGDGRVCCERDERGRCTLWRPPGGSCP